MPLLEYRRRRNKLRVNLLVLHEKRNTKHVLQQAGRWWCNLIRSTTAWKEARAKVAKELQNTKAARRAAMCPEAGQK